MAGHYTECLALKQRAEHTKFQFLLKGQRSKGYHTFLPKGIQIEELTQASYHAYSESARSACWIIMKKKVKAYPSNSTKGMCPPVLDSQLHF